MSGATGSYDIGDQRVELTWETPPQERAAFNYVSGPHEERRDNVFTPSLPLQFHSPNYPLPQGSTTAAFLNLIVPAVSTGYYANTTREPGGSDLNFLPYHQYVGVDYRNKTGSTLTVCSPITPSDLKVNKTYGIRHKV